MVPGPHRKSACGFPKVRGASITLKLNVQVCRCVKSKMYVSVKGPVISGGWLYHKQAVIAVVAAGFGEGSTPRSPHDIANTVMRGSCSDEEITCSNNRDKKQGWVLSTSALPTAKPILPWFSAAEC